MSQVIIAGDTSGTITLQAPAVSGSTVLTLPAATGTVMVSGNMPAFSAYRATSGQTITAATNTKVQFNGEEFDTANCFDSTTNYRFTPNVAGYYLLQWQISIYATSGTMNITFANLWKNGSNYKGGSYLHGVSLDTWQSNNSAIVYANGTTDYFEIYAYGNATANAVDYGNTGTYFTGSLVRAA